MSQEDKELLLKDLCARLPYKVECKAILNNGGSYPCVLDIGTFNWHISGDHVLKPYLRPMSSITEEEKKEAHRLFTVLYDRNDVICGIQINSFVQLDKVTEWLNKHHFDYRGLIERDLALEASEGMY